MIQCSGYGVASADASLTPMKVSENCFNLLIDTVPNVHDVAISELARLRRRDGDDGRD